MVPAHIIYRIYSSFGVTPAKHFDMIAGTSTGAIIAAALACEVDPSRVVDLYQKHGGRIFRKKRSLWPSFLKQAAHSLYDQSELATLLFEVFGDKKLGELTRPLILPSTNISDGCVHVFKSGYSSEFVRDRDVLVRDAIIASCSAPTYFDPSKVGTYLLADGGLWANNPALTATIDAMHRMKIDSKCIRVVSLGTGSAKNHYSNLTSSWGLLSGWRHKEFISFILSLQSQSAHNHLSLMLPKSQVLRLDFESDKELPLDDISSVDGLISRADKIFTDQSAEIKMFLNIT